MPYNMCNTQQRELQIHNYSLFNVLEDGVCIIKLEIMICALISQYAKL